MIFPQLELIQAAAESDTTTARPCAPALKQSSGDRVVGPGLQEKSAQHFLPVGLLIASIEGHNAVHKVLIMERLSQHYSLVSNMIRAFADEGGLHNRQQELHGSRRTE